MMSIAASFPAAEPIARTRRATRPATTFAPNRRNQSGAAVVSGRGTRRVAARTTGSPRGSVRLTRRGRLALGVLVSLPFAALLVITGSVSADAGTQPGVSSPTAVVVVQPGESLWQIAQAVDPSADPRSTVVVIRELNGLGTDTVVPGQSLVVPQ